MSHITINYLHVVGKVLKVSVALAMQAGLWIEPELGACFLQHLLCEAVTTPNRGLLLLSFATACYLKNTSEDSLKCLSVPFEQWCPVLRQDSLMPCSIVFCQSSS